jgi:hypothetical protein
MTVSQPLISRFRVSLLILGGELSQILPYRHAKRGLTSGISAAESLKMPPWPLTAAVGLREIINDLI